jgi:hypothetical protein
MKYVDFSSFHWMSAYEEAEVARSSPSLPA